MKQILFNLQGYAKPKEILAIMGGSGSGKTTTLNIFAQRLKVLAGAKFDGEVKVNNRQLNESSFGKVGAYVLQDDILVATMSPRECFTFACQLRTSLDNEEIEFKVEDLL
jgi:ABC-type multidrug transport system ATPase subunit